MFKYIGSKRLLLDKILHEIKKFDDISTILDLFSGTSRVGHMLQNNGYNVIANDHNTYAYYTAITYVQSDPDDYKFFPDIIKELNNFTGYNGWFSELYSNKTKFFTQNNAELIQAIRDEIERTYKNTIYYIPLIISLIEAADRVDSTCGLQMSYLKSYAPRAYNRLAMRFPNMSKGSGQAKQLDASEAAKIPCDVAYIDPPYNQHSYLANYHIWETICLWDQPQTYGKIHKRIDVKTRKSLFNYKKNIKEAFQTVIDNLNANYVLISFNDEGYLTSNDIENIIINKYKDVIIQTIPYSRYIGAKIGIHNNQGEKVGTIKSINNNELLFIGKK